MYWYWGLRMIITKWLECIWYRVFSTYGSDAGNSCKMYKNIVLNKSGMLLDILYTLKTHQSASSFLKQGISMIFYISSSSRKFLGNPSKICNETSKIEKSRLSPFWWKLHPCSILAPWNKPSGCPKELFCVSNSRCYVNWVYSY